MTDSMAEYIWIGTDNVLRVRCLKDVVAGTYINDAVVKATLYDSEGDAVSGASNITLSYVSGTNGDYAGEIPDTIDMTDGAMYYVLVTITGDGYTTKIRMDLQAAYKGP